MQRNPNAENLFNNPDKIVKGIRFYMSLWLAVLSSCLMLLFSNPGLASDSQPESKQTEIQSTQADIAEKPEEEKNTASETRTHKVDSFHAALSRSISSSADWIDSYFGEERSEIEEENSSLRSGLRLIGNTTT